jgi:hypothetical protein
LTEIINKMRTELGEPPARHDNVLREVRRVRNNLDVSAALSFEDCYYVGRNGKTLAMIRFSEDVLPAVIGRYSPDVTTSSASDHIATRVA